MPEPIIDWSEIETVLLDMDGTLLDLYYDNHFWREYLPEHYARLHALEPDHARSLLTEKFQARQGELAFYCIEHWSRELALDILPLKSHVDQHIRYLPGALELLGMFGDRGIEKVLVTNAHRQILTLKDEAVGICSYVDAHYASHDFGLPKEDPDFWPALANAHHFDPAKTVLIDDNSAVLDAASHFALAACVLPLQPDSSLPASQPLHRLPEPVGRATSTRLLRIESLLELMPA